MTGPGDSVDPQIAHYREFLERLERPERGDEDLELAVGSQEPGATDAIEALGESIASLAASITARYERERQFAEGSQEIAKGVYLNDVLDHVYESFRPFIPCDRIGCALLEREGTFFSNVPIDSRGAINRLPVLQQYQR